MGADALALRVRVPGGAAITGVTVGGQSYTRFDRDTIDLTGLSGRVVLQIR